MTAERGEGGLPPEEIEGMGMGSIEDAADTEKIPETLEEALKIIQSLQEEKRYLANELRRARRDLTKAQEQGTEYQVAAEQALFDSLTGLRRREGIRFWLEHLFKPHSVDAERRHAEGASGPEHKETPPPAFLTVLMLDIDKFKVFNDTYGHPAGDAVLQQAGRFLQGIFRETDCVVRWGGEEIVVLLPDVSAGAVMNKLSHEQIPWQKRQEERDAGRQITPKQNAHPQLYFTATFTDASGNEQTQQVTFSGGVATIEISSSQIHELDSRNTPQVVSRVVDVADRALYAAKQHGRNQIFPAEDHEY